MSLIEGGRTTWSITNEMIRTWVLRNEVSESPDKGRMALTNNSSIKETEK